MADGILNPIEQLEADFDFDVYTKQEVDALLDEKADKSDTYTKTETDALLDEKADADAVYTKTETDTLLSAKADADNVYTKTETNNLLNGKADKSTTLAGYGITDAYTKTQTDNLLNAKANADSVYTKAEIDTELTVTKDGTWVKGTQTTATNLQKLEGGIEYLYGLLSHQYDQLKKYINGNYYDYDTDTNSKYVKTVPQGAMPYASIEQIGGKTLVWNQLNRCNAQTYSYNGITFTNNGDGSFTVTGTATQRVVWYINSPNVLNVTPGQKFIYTAFCTDSSMYSHICMGIYEDTTWRRIVNANTILTVGANENKLVYVYIEVLPNMGEVNFTISSLILSDLTLMFGAGNEPTTVAEFRQMFPAVWYAFNEGTLLSAGVTEVVSKDSNNATLQTIPIPAEIQALEGYGWSAGTVFNYIDYETKKFVKRVGSVDLGTLTWTTASNNRFRAELDSIPLLADNNSYPIAICPKYEGATPNNYINYDDVFHFSSTIHAIYIRDTSYSDVATFTSAVSGVYMNYALTTPVEVDISAYITDDNLIEVEAGGSLTFPNSNGDDYRIPIPSSETYMVDLQEAI